MFSAECTGPTGPHISDKIINILGYTGPTGPYLRDKIIPLSRTERFDSPYNKIVTPDEAISKSINWKYNGERVVVVDSVLDIPHYRHADFLLKCANLGDKLILRVNSDEFVASRKDPLGPIVSLENRQKHAAHYPYVDLVTVKSEAGWNWLYKYQPTCVVKSVTSGPKVLKEISEASPYFKNSGSLLIIMDEFANIIPTESYFDEGIKYEENKFDPNKISGSIIKSEIIRRHNLTDLLS